MDKVIAIGFVLIVVFFVLPMLLGIDPQDVDGLLDVLDNGVQLVP